MKKILIFLIFISVCVIHAQTDDKETIQTLNQKITAAYQKSDLNNALKYARQFLELAIKLNGTDHKDTATAYTNLGIILRDKQKYKDSIENLQNAIGIYEKESGKNKASIARVLDILTGVQFLSGNSAASEKSGLDSLKIREEVFGKESKEAYLSNLSMAELYARIKNIEKANEYYLKSYALAFKVFGKNDSEFEKIDESRVCSIPGVLGKDKEFEEAKEKLLGFKQSQILNGKAKKLGRPAYPPLARAVGAEGLVAVKILIDEQGKPTQATAICGHPLLRSSTEDAALNSKFEPTLKNGVAIQIKGYIQYNFVR